MTTAWRCAPCQRMRRIQITQWSGSRACNLLAKIEFRCGWLRWRKWDCVGALPGRSVADRVAATRAHASQAVSASCHCNQNFALLPKRYSPPNPESASIGRKLGWRNLHPVTTLLSTAGALITVSNYQHALLTTNHNPQSLWGLQRICGSGPV